jgi:hypothetical protein
LFLGTSRVGHEQTNHQHQRGRPQRKGYRIHKKMESPFERICPAAPRLANFLVHVAQIFARLLCPPVSFPRMWDRSNDFFHKASWIQHWPTTRLGDAFRGNDAQAH